MSDRVTKVARAAAAEGQGGDALPPGGGGSTGVGGRRKGRLLRSGVSAYLYLVPAGLLLGGFVLAPLAATVFYSFTDWDGLSRPTFVGWANYVDQLADPRTLAALRNALYLLVFFSLIPIALGLVFAAVLNRKKMPGLGFSRAVLFLPQVIPLVVIGYAWKWVYSTDGVLNEALRAAGLDSWTRYWLADMTWSLTAVGVVAAWVNAGFCMVLFLSGIARIDQALYDAAQVDGAGRIREFFAVTLPGIRGELLVALTVTVIGGLRSFDVVYTTTGGGPIFATQVPALRVYQLAFQASEPAAGASVAVMLTVVIATIGLLLQRIPKSVD